MRVINKYEGYKYTKMLEHGNRTLQDYNQRYLRYKTSVQTEILENIINNVIYNRIQGTRSKYPSGRDGL